MLKDGGPAFPTEHAAHLVDREGMSLRDYFAGQAMVALGPLMPTLAALQIDAGMSDNRIIADRVHTQVATASYRLADALLAARGDRL